MRRNILLAVVSVVIIVVAALLIFVRVRRGPETLSPQEIQTVIQEIQ